MSDKRVVLRNYEGGIFQYPEPKDRVSVCPPTCKMCDDYRKIESKEGVAGVLSGEKIRPDPRRDREGGEAEGATGSTDLPRRIVRKPLPRTFRLIPKPLSEAIIFFAVSPARRANGVGTFSLRSSRTRLSRQQTIEFVERKGIGHPDSIADGLAESVSRALCKMYIERYGRILHHNTDETRSSAVSPPRSSAAARCSSRSTSCSWDERRPNVNGERLPYRTVRDEGGVLLPREDLQEPRCRMGRHAGLQDRPGQRRPEGPLRDAAPPRERHLVRRGVRPPERDREDHARDREVHQRQALQEDARAGRGRQGHGMQEGQGDRPHDRVRHGVVQGAGQEPLQERHRGDEGQGRRLRAASTRRGTSRSS